MSNTPATKNDPRTAATEATRPRRQWPGRRLYPPLQRPPCQCTATGHAVRGRPLRLTERQAATHGLPPKIGMAPKAIVNLGRNTRPPSENRDGPKGHRKVRAQRTASPVFRWPQGHRSAPSLRAQYLLRETYPASPIGGPARCETSDLSREASNPRTRD